MWIRCCHNVTLAIDPCRIPTLIVRAQRVVPPSSGCLQLRTLSTWSRVLRSVCCRACPYYDGLRPRSYSEAYCSWTTSINEPQCFLRSFASGSGKVPRDVPWIRRKVYWFSQRGSWGAVALALGCRNTGGEGIYVFFSLKLRYRSRLSLFLFFFLT